jgi:YD repeat-containing protein
MSVPVRDRVFLRVRLYRPKNTLTAKFNCTTRYQYDALNRLTADTNALGYNRSYRYDAVGNLSSTIDRNGRVINYLYDNLDRQTQEQWVDSAGNIVRSITSQYDAASQLTSIAEPNSRYTYAYDLEGRLIMVDNTGTFGVPSVLLNYGYDAVDNLTSVTDTINGHHRASQRCPMMTSIA